MSIFLYSCKSAPHNVSANGTIDNNGTVQDNGDNIHDVFSVSEEQYAQTLDYVNNFIASVNTAIKEDDFEKWKSFLSDKYIDAYDSQEDLAEYSEMFKKKGYDIRLVNLKDYFDNVVVASRRNIEISHLEFIDETHLKVMTLYRNESAVMYYMELINNEWKISVW